MAPRLPKVVFVVDSLEHPNGGTEGQLLSLLTGLVDIGVRPELILLRGSAQIAQHVPAVSVRIAGIHSLGSLRSIVAAIRLASQLRRAGVAVAHLYFNDTSILLPPILRAFGIKVIISRRDLGFWYTPAILRVLRFNRQFVSRVVVNSRAVAAAVAEKEGYPADRITVIYNSLLRGFEPAADAATDQAKAVKVIGLVANLRPLKRIDVAIRALAELISSGMPSRLVVVGEDGAGWSLPSHREELMALANGLGVAEHVEFTGLVARPEALLAGFDACVLCSESEGFSNSVIEYMAAGKPAVCTDVGGASEVIVHESNGLLVPVGDHESLARALRRVLCDAQFAERLASAARATVRDRFSRRAMTQQHCELYASLGPDGEAAAPGPTATSVE